MDLSTIAGTSEKSRADGRNERRRRRSWRAITVATMVATVGMTVVAATPASATTPGIITTVAGGDAPGPVPATNVAIGGPAGLAVAGGKVYVTDNQFHVVRTVASSDGTEHVVAGNGTQGSLGDGGPATAAEMNGPQSVVADSAGNMLIADAGNSAVRLVSASTGNIVSIGNGSYGYAGDGGPVTGAVLAAPHGVAVDGAANIVIADTGNDAIRVVAHSNGTFYGVSMTALDIYTVAGGIGSGYFGDGGPATEAGLFLPMGVSPDSAGNLLIADAGHNAIRVLAGSDGTFYGQAMTAGYIYTVAGGNGAGYSGNGGPATDAQLDVPQGVTALGAGNFLIADAGNNTVRWVKDDGVIYRLVGDATAGYSGDGGPAADAQLNNPASVAVDADGNLLIADFNNHRVRAVATADGTFYGVAMTAGNLYTIAGLGLPGRSGDGEDAIQAEMRFPSAVAVDSFGNYVIAEPFDGAVRVAANSTGTFYGVPMTAGKAYTIAGNDTLSFSGDGGPSTAAAVNLAFGVGIDGAGNIVIADTNNNRLRVIAKSTGTFYGQAMTVGNIYTIVDVDGTEGYAGDGGPGTAAAMLGPWAVTADGSGNVVFIDLGNQVVRVVAAAAGTFYGVAMTAGNIYTVAGNGTAGYSGDAGPATSAQLFSPTGVAVDHAGNLIIADAGNSRLRVVAESDGTFYGQAMTAGNVYTVAGNGTPGISADGGPALAAELAGPWGVAVDLAGNVVFADSGSSRIRVVAETTATFYGQAMTAGNLYTIAGSDPLGGYAGDGGPATAAILWDDAGIAVDGAGNVLISDFGNHRIRKVTGGPLAPPLGLGSLSTTAWTVNRAGFTGTIAVNGGAAPYTVDAQSGLPTGLTATVSGSTISFTGTPTVAGTFASGSVTIKDATGATAVASFSITINPALSFGSLSTTAWTVNQAGFTGTIAVSGGTSPYSVDAQSGLPNGLTATVSGSTVSFTGTPTVAGTFGSGSVTIKDAAGATATKTFSITINPALSFGSLSTTAWTVNQAGFTGTIAVSGGTTPYTVDAQSGLPNGLTATVTGSTISFTGTPTVAGTFGSGSVTIKDAAGATATKTFSITINPALSFGSLSTTAWTVNQAGFTGTIAVNGGTTPYTVDAQSGLPNGLTATVTGSTISFTGTPTVAGTFGSGSVTIKDAAGATAIKTFSITINNMATPTLVTHPSATSVTLGKTAPTLTDTATVSGGNHPTGTVTFTLYYNGGATPVYTSPPVTLTSGTASASYTLPGTGVQYAGMYQWDATYSGDASNNSVTDNDDPAELVTVTAAGEFGFGIGTYTPSASVGSTGFGFVVAQNPKGGYSGQLNVVTPNKWWFQGTVASYAKTSRTQGLLSGTGTLYSWNAALNKGRGGWQLAASSVTYKATANAGTKSTASFGITISSTASGLPSSSPVALSRGAITIM